MLAPTTRPRPRGSTTGSSSPTWPGHSTPGWSGARSSPASPCWTRRPPGCTPTSRSSRHVTCCATRRWRPAPSSAPVPSIGPDTTLIDCRVADGADGASGPTAHGATIGRTPRSGPFTLPAAGHRAGRRRQGRRLRRDQEVARSAPGAKVPAPVLRRRRHDRRRRQHRRRHDHRQLRRRQQVPDGHRCRTPSSAPTRTLVAPVTMGRRQPTSRPARTVTDDVAAGDTGRRPRPAGDATPGWVLGAQARHRASPRAATAAAPADQRITAASAPGEVHRPGSEPREPLDHHPQEPDAVLRPRAIRISPTRSPSTSTSRSPRRRPTTSPTARSSSGSRSRSAGPTSS